MPTTLIYANRGRRLIWLGTAVNLYLELTDDEEFDMQEAHETGVAFGLFGSATVALFIPDPEATLLGFIATKIAPYAGAVTLGYGAGALVGTVIADEVFDAKQEAIDLYTNPKFEPGGITYETADILGNAWRIVKHYQSNPPPNRHGKGTTSGAVQRYRYRNKHSYP